MAKSSKKASVPMIHSIPELKVSEELAKKLGRADTDRLLTDRKLALLVDLDQTIIHTTNDNVPNNLKVAYDSLGCVAKSGQNCSELNRIFRVFTLKLFKI